MPSAGEIVRVPDAGNERSIRCIAPVSREHDPWICIALVLSATSRQNHTPAGPQIHPGEVPELLVDIGGFRPREACIGCDGDPHLGTGCIIVCKDNPAYRIYHHGWIASSHASHNVLTEWRPSLAPVGGTALAKESLGFVQGESVASYWIESFIRFATVADPRPALRYGQQSIIHSHDRWDSSARDARRHVKVKYWLGCIGAH